MESQVNIIIADDHPLFRMGVKTLIDETERYTLIAEANNGEEARTIVQQYQPDIAVVDIDMPKLNGIELAKYIQQNTLPVKIVFLTSHSNFVLFKKAYDTGFSGFLFKESAMEELEACFSSIMQGKQYISETTRDFLEQSHERLRQINELEQLLAKLTAAEKQILMLIMEHKTTKEIAEELVKSYKTIENHRLNISHKFNIRGTNNLLSFALNHKQDIRQILNLSL